MITFYGTLAQLEEQRALTFPARGVAIGGPDRWPAEYSPGAPGWTADFLSDPYVSGAGYALDIPDAAEPYLGKVSTTKTRVLILGIGESGMVGANYVENPRPAGYPKADGSMWSFDASHRWTLLHEPTHDAGPAPLESAYDVPINDVRVSFAGMFCWHLQALLGDSFEVGFIPCGRSGTSSTDWAVGGQYCTTTIERTRLALEEPRTVLGAILLEQGINDARWGLAAATGWAARWTAIESAIRAGIGAPSCPLYFSRHCPTRPVIDAMTDASWAQLLAEQDSWVSSQRFTVQKPDGPWFEPELIHLLTSAQIILAESYRDTWIAHPGVTS